MTAGGDWQEIGRVQEMDHVKEMQSVGSWGDKARGADKTDKLPIWGAASGCQVMSRDVQYASRYRRVSLSCNRLSLGVYSTRCTGLRHAPMVSPSASIASCFSSSPSSSFAAPLSAAASSPRTSLSSHACSIDCTILSLALGSIA